MTRTLLSGGLAAGVLAGLVAALLQFFLIQPLIVEAERYEDGELFVIGIVQPEGDEADDHAHGHSHSHGDEDEESLLLRNGLTVLTLILTWAGFGLLAGAGLTAFRALPGGVSPSPVALGLAGFAAVSLAPGMGLPPDLPGMEAADLASRQLWWTMTAVATAAGLFLAAGFRNWPVRLAGLALIVLPHLIGAPPPPETAPAVPPDLAALYAMRVLGVNFVGWLALAAALVWLLPAPARAEAR